MDDLQNKRWWGVRSVTCGAVLWASLGFAPCAVHAAPTVALQIPFLVAQQAPPPSEPETAVSPQREIGETSRLNQQQGVVETPLLRENAPAPEANAPDLRDTAAPNDGRRPGRTPGSRPEALLRALMTGFGFGDEALQNVLVDYINSEAKARGRLRQKAIALFEALRSPEQMDAQVATLTEAYQQATDAEKLRRRAAEDKLNQQVGFRTNPRLEAMLVLFGFVGDNPVSVPFNVPRGIYNRRLERGDKAAEANLPSAATTPGARPVTTSGFGYREGVAAPRIDRVMPTLPTPGLPTAGAVTIEEDAESRGPAREGRLVGAVAERRDDGFDVRDRNGVLYRFTPRWLGGLPEQGGGLDPEILATMASFKPGDRIRVTWFLDDRLRAAIVERVVTAPTPATPTAPTSLAPSVIPAAPVAPPLTPAADEAPGTKERQTPMSDPEDAKAEMNKTDEVVIENQTAPE